MPKLEIYNSVDLIDFRTSRDEMWESSSIHTRAAFRLFVVLIIVLTVTVLAILFWQMSIFICDFFNSRMKIEEQIHLN